MGNSSLKAAASEEIAPWRDVPWNSRDALRSDILQYKPRSPDIEKTNIVLFGLVGSGKSSIVNSLGTIMKERISAEAEVLSDLDSSASVTKKFRIYTFGGNEECRFTLCDTMGMEEEQGLDLVDVPYILNGHIPHNFEFPNRRITPDDPGYIQSPTKSNRMHGIVYVVDATKVDIGAPVVVAKFNKLRELASARNIRISILVTHIDMLCPLVATNVKMAYRSSAVVDIVKKISQLTGLPESFIFAVKNYKEETDADPFLDVLLLKALKLILCYADDCF